jgi:hypothetical protein
MVGSLKLAKVLGPPTVEVVVTTATAKVRQSTCYTCPALHGVGLCSQPYPTPHNIFSFSGLQLYPTGLW